MEPPVATDDGRQGERRLIPYDPVDHAAWTRGMERAEDLMGLAAVRYARFKRPACVTRVTVRPWSILFGSEGRRSMAPAHLLVQVSEPDSTGWRTVADVDLAKPGDRDGVDVDLPPTVTNHLRVVCDRKHPLPPIHANWWVGEDIVPFSILEGLEFWGSYQEPGYEPPYHRPLAVGTVAAAALPGQTVVREPHQVTYRSPYFSVGFSLRRPMIVHLGWDHLGTGRSAQNLLPHGSVRVEGNSYCGPTLRTVELDADPYVWSGRVEVDGNRVSYRDLRAVDDFRLDVDFEVDLRGMRMSIRKACARGSRAVEADDWRFVWAGRECITGTLGLPVRANGRTGVVPLPAMWNAPGHGCLGVRESEPASGQAVLQADSWRAKGIGWSGVSLGWQRDPFGALSIEEGTYSASLTLEVTSPSPRGPAPTSPGLLRNWSSVFGFRPELAGFSNNSLSCNCHMSQYLVADMVAQTADPDPYPAMAELLRYTVELAVKGGPGYGEGFIDNDPSLLIALCRVQETRPDASWVRAMLPHVERLLRRIFAGIDDTGLYRCSTLSGNSGSKRWGSNAWDVVSFGHYDAYGNALVYRALRSVAALLAATGEVELAGRCGAGAERLRSGFRTCFLNPDTGWLAGWRSADGELHDYAFTHVNYMAVCYGLVGPEDARAIVDRLEEKMRQAGLTYFRYGIPVNLVSVRNADAPSGNDYERADGMDSYGVYVNGCLTTCWVGYYLTALSMCGFDAKADLVRDQLEEYFATADASGALWAGTEFRTWEGRPCGYEGVCVGSYPVLGAMVQRDGVAARTSWRSAI
jgi:hypothetical protein